MGHAVTSIESLPLEGKRGYILYHWPDSLWIGDDDEHLTNVQAQSQRAAMDIVVAGGIKIAGNTIVIDGMGCPALGIEPRDPSRAILVVQQLPGVNPHQVLEEEV